MTIALSAPTPRGEVLRESVGLLGAGAGMRGAELTSRLALERDRVDRDDRASAG